MQMTVQECYESMGSDFEGVLGRMGSEAMVKRFALKFLDDPSYGNLVKAVEEQNAEEAFRAAHTLKRNLSESGTGQTLQSQCVPYGETPGERVQRI